MKLPQFPNYGNVAQRSGANYSEWRQSLAAANEPFSPHLPQDGKPGLIEIEETLDTPARCGVIAHEIGHELMHRTNREGTTRQQRELEAESVSYAVLAHFGIHSESRFYLATYDVTAEMLTASLQTIGNAAKKIISLIENSGEQIEEGEGEQSPAPLAVPA